MSELAYHFGPFTLAPRRLVLKIGDVDLPAGPKVVETLLALIERPGEIVTKAEMLDRVWPDGFVEEANLAQNIYVLRKVLRAHWIANAIQTVPRRGYRFVAAVTREPDSSRAKATVKRQFGWSGIAAAIAALFVLAAGGGGLVANKGTASPHQLALTSTGSRYYAMARYYWNQRTAAGLQKSVRYFVLVTQTDPRDARGFAGLAEAYALLGDYGYGPLSVGSAYRRARRYARIAVARNDFSAEAHAAMGIAQDVPATRSAARNEYRKAIALDPLYAPAHQWYGISLLEQGQVNAGFGEIRTAASLDPVSVAATTWLSEAAYLSRRYHEAIALAHQALDLSPARRDAYVSLGLAYEQAGDYRDALDAFQAYGRHCMMCEGESAALLAHAYARTHNIAQADIELNRARRANAAAAADPHDIIVALVAMGRRTEALTLLRRPADPHEQTPIAIDPRMDVVRGDIRFAPYLRTPA